MRGILAVVRISHAFEPENNLGVYMDDIPRVLWMLPTEDIYYHSALEATSGCQIC
jgi:hypothetical protein